MNEDVVHVILSRNMTWLLCCMDRRRGGGAFFFTSEEMAISFASSNWKPR